jgi:AP2-like factor, euAP2 lineage
MRQNMFEILVSDDVKLLFDKKEYEIAKNYTWRVRKCKNGKFSVLADINKHRYSVKQLVFKLPKDIYIYHKNGNPYDFRRSEIEIITKSEYFHKQNPNIPRSSKYKNVFYDETNNKWSTAVIKGKSHFAGRYLEEEEAAIAADRLMLQLYGDKAERNFPELSTTKLEDKYSELEMKYGKSEKEKRARTVQGITMQKDVKSSKFVGVYWEKRKQKWVAEIRYLRKRYWLGLYDEEDAAARSYDIKALELYGENAKTNFKQGGS